MRMLKFNRITPTRILLVWNGTRDHIQHAEQCIEAAKVGSVLAVHAMPHESIYSYGAARHSRDEGNYAERKLKKRFREVVQHSNVFEGTQLELLFGDQVTEISRFAKAMKVQSILFPRFAQSAFSKWVHGDLNERMARRAPCPIIFLQSSNGKSNESPVFDSA